MTRSILIYTASIVGIVAGYVSAANAVVWTGPDLAFSQDEGVPASEIDVLVPGVASLARGTQGPMCNTLAGDSCTGGAAGAVNPSDFEFAFSDLNGNTSIAYGSAASHSVLTFDTFANALDNQVGNNMPNDSNAFAPTTGVGHVISQDIYFDIEFTGWGSYAPGAAAYAYRRSSPIPEPGTALLFGMGLLALAVGRRS